MAKRKTTKLVMSARTKTSAHHPTSKHVVEKLTGKKRTAKKVMVKC